MANRHFGEIGDVWKHLALAEILRIERPVYYAESHAGSSVYDLTHSPGRDYGAYYFFEHAGRSKILESSTYFQMLRQLTQDGRLTQYPGSPAIAINLLAKGAKKFFFCDQDASSLQTIRKAAAKHGLSGKVLETSQNDGIDSLEDLFSNVSSLNADQMLAFLDPYQPQDRSPKGTSAIDLFGYLARRDVKAVLWYGYTASTERDVILRRIRTTLTAGDFDISDSPGWCGEICLPIVEPDSGLLGCGVACMNLSRKAIDACVRLGEALEIIYRTAVLADGVSGAIEFHSFSLAV